jgi:hypothetical protein
VSPVTAAATFGRDQHLITQGLAQGFDAGSFVDRRPDHGEVEAVGRADIAVKDLFQVERQVDYGNWLASCAARVDDQELVDADGTVQRFFPTALTLRRLERHHQIGGGW